MHGYTLSWEYYRSWWSFLAATDKPIIESYEFAAKSDEEAKGLAKEKIRVVRASLNSEYGPELYAMFSTSLHRRIPLGNILSD